MRRRTERLVRDLRTAGIPVAVSIRTYREDPDLILINPRLAVEVFGDLRAVSVIREDRKGFRARLVDQGDVLALVREAMAEGI